MRFAAFVGNRTASIGTSPEFVQAQSDLLDELGLVRLDWSAPATEILGVMKRDKKVRGGKLKFVLVSDVGAWQLVELGDGEVLAALEEYYAQ